GAGGGPGGAGGGRPPGRGGAGRRAAPAPLPPPPPPPPRARSAPAIRARAPDDARRSSPAPQSFDLARRPSSCDHASIRHARRTVAVAYFVVFLGAGVFLPYFPLYLSHLGFSGWQIVVLMRLHPALRSAR